MKGSALAGATVATAAVLTASGCTTSPGPPQDVMGAGQPNVSHVDVDTPALRQVKQSSGVAPCPVSDPGRKPADEGLPDVALACLGGGRTVHMAGLRGKPMVLNLWASWCTPCRDELPVLQDFYERADGKVTMVGVDFEDTRPGAALKLLKETGVTYPQVADFGKEIDKGLGRHPVPMTVLVSPSGEVVRKLPLQLTSSDQLAGLVEQSLGVGV